MSTKTLSLTPEILQYLQSVSVRELPALRDLRYETENHTGAKMQISPEQGQLMCLLARLIRAKKALDIGTFTGYSAMTVALALPDDGHLHTIDVHKEVTDIAKQYWRLGGVHDKITQHLGKANDILDGFINDKQTETFDFIFIDADKNNYDQYYEKSLQLLKPTGLILIDNVLWGGQVADPSNNDSATLALRALNKKLHEDNRIHLSMVPIGDGLTLAIKK